MKVLLAIVLMVSIISCGRNHKSDNCGCCYSVSVEGHWSISKEEISKAVSSVLKQNETSRYSVEITVFGYSSGKEVFYYFKDNSPDDIKIKTYSGNINALVKIKKQKILRKVIFLNAEGNSKEEILQALAKELQRAICNNFQ
ncbi:MAG: hypothetical protein JXN64_01840 [Spirochaetes bacterium]|nr:hypothetical protein [Spirochaetota bacterium]